MISKEKRGGKRTGSGAKPKYKEATVTVSFRVPSSHKDTVKKMVKDYLQGLTTNPQRVL